MPRKLLVCTEEKDFYITIPDDAKVTFGPWSPPTQHNISLGTYKNQGTLRIYKSNKENQLACFSNVLQFYDVSLRIQKKIRLPGIDNVQVSGTYMISGGSRGQISPTNEVFRGTSTSHF